MPADDTTVVSFRTYCPFPTPSSTAPERTALNWSLPAERRIALSESLSVISIGESSLSFSSRTEAFSVRRRLEKLFPDFKAIRLLLKWRSVYSKSTTIREMRDINLVGVNVISATA